MGPVESLPPAPPEVTMLPGCAWAGLQLLLACKQGELCWAGASCSCSLPLVPQGELVRSSLPLGKAVLRQPTLLPGKEKLFQGEEEPSSFWEESSEARYESELIQLSAQVTIKRLNMNKCCRFIYNVSFYLWNVSEWFKDTKNVVRNCS